MTWSDLSSDDVIDSHPEEQVPSEVHDQKGDIARSPCKTVADANFLVVNDKMTEKVAYDCVKTFIEKREELMKVTPHAAEFVPEKASVGIIPFHPGAIKYFKEKGITVK